MRQTTISSVFAAMIAGTAAQISSDIIISAAQLSPASGAPAEPSAVLRIANKVIAGPRPGAQVKAGRPVTTKRTTKKTIKKTTKKTTIRRVPKKNQIAKSKTIRKTTKKTTTKKTTARTAAAVRKKTTPKRTTPPKTTAPSSRSSSTSTSSIAQPSSSGNNVRSSSSSSAVVPATTSSQAQTNTTTRSSSRATSSTTPRTTIAVTTATSASSTVIAANGTPRVFAVAPYPSNLRDYDFSGTSQHESDHFLVWNTTADKAAVALRVLEGTYNCFVVNQGWKNSGVPFHNNSAKGPFYKTNAFTAGTLPIANAAGIATGDYNTGLGFTMLHPGYIDHPGVVSHEFGHVMNFAQIHFWTSRRAMAWAEPIAQYVNEAYIHSPICAESRALVGEEQGWTLFAPRVTISKSWMTIVEASASGNQYEAWPFLIYLAYNPDKYSNLGPGFLLKLFQMYNARAEETPFHTLDRLAAPVTSQQLVARYWARMAWVDYNHPAMQYTWNVTRGQLDYANTFSTGNGTWRVVAAKRPLYLGSSIIPLNTSVRDDNSLSVRVEGSAVFLATLAVRSSLDGTVRYIPLDKTTVSALETGDGTASSAVYAQAKTVTVAEHEKAMLVVANTPDKLLLYDNSRLSGPAAVGLDFNVTLAGATAASSVPSVPRCYYTQRGC